MSTNTEVRVGELLSDDDSGRLFPTSPIDLYSSTNIVQRSRLGYWTVTWLMYTDVDGRILPTISRYKVWAWREKRALNSARHRAQEQEYLLTESVLGSFDDAVAIHALHELISSIGDDIISDNKDK